MTGRTDAAESSIPVQWWTGIRYRDQDVRFKAPITRPPLIGDLDATHVAKLKRQEVHPLFHADLIRKLGDPHLVPRSVIRAHRLAVGMAVDQKSITLGGIIRLSPCYETLQIRGIGRVQVDVLIFGDFRKVSTAREALDGVLLDSVEPGAGEIVAKKSGALLMLVAAVDEKGHLDSRIIVDRAAYLVHKRHKRIVSTVIHCPVDE